MKSLTEELIDIVASYLSSGQIDGKQIKKPSAMLRSLDGKIQSWDDCSKKLYGWTQDQAIGANSHALLRTNFPEDLEQINNRLEIDGYWKGSLIHHCSEGRKIESQSTWKLLKQGGLPQVLELNLPCL